MLFGFSTGLVNSAAPQAARALLLSSSQLGFVGAGVPVGYALSCVLCGMFLNSFAVKRVMLCGIAGAIASLLWMAVTRDAYSLIGAQLAYGMFSGAFWPFCSAWMLDFESPAISNTRILRHYNVSWTAGTAMGMYCGGLLCQRGAIFPAFQAAACFAATAWVVSALSPAALRHRETSSLESSPESAPVRQASARRASAGELAAAATFNLSAIGTKLLIAVNFVEMNEKIGGGAGRMGVLMAAATLSQLIAFGAGRIYEPHLGTRRVYVCGAALLLAANFAFARCDSTWILLPATIAVGFVLAVGFQAAMIAFTSRARIPRNGTALAESLVGFSGLAPLAGGFLTDQLKSSGLPLLDTLRAPFYAAIALIALALVTQLLLVSANKNRRLLASSI